MGTTTNYDGSASSVAHVTTMASAMLFGTILFATIALATRAYLLSATTADRNNSNNSNSKNNQWRELVAAASHPKSKALNVKSLASVYALLFHCSIFGLILFYAYICEYHPPYPHADKNYDADQFFFLTVLLLVVSVFTWQKHIPDEHEHEHEHHHHEKNDDETNSNSSNSNNNNNNKNMVLNANASNACNANANANANGNVCVAKSNDRTEVLNRNQTEEWKGWMQFMFLLYHYYHAEEVYNSIRIMITCYVWMTGFGNFSFFYLKADYGIVRVLQMLWRLNFLVLFLCLTQGTTYILYYICLLHTYYFFVVYVTMRIGKEHNYSCSSSNNSSSNSSSNSNNRNFLWWIRTKLAVLGVVIYLVWDCDLGLFKILHYPFLGETPMKGATGGAMWEWYFRSSLDHWSTYLGMVFALNFPITSLWFRKLEAIRPVGYSIAAKGLVGIAMGSVLYWWVKGPFRSNKFDYNQTNAYFGIVPVTAYIYFRNCTPWLRNHSLDLLHQIGKTTLETYLMQHHIWLTSDAKSLLTLVPGYPKVNFLVVSIVYVAASRRLYQLTLFLRGMILPDNSNKETCFRNLGGMVGIVLAYCFLASALNSQNLLTLKVVGIVSVSGGYGLCVALLKHTTTTTTTYTQQQQQQLQLYPVVTTVTPTTTTATTATATTTTHGDLEQQPNNYHHRNNNNNKNNNNNNNSNATMKISIAVATFSVLCCGIGWNTMATNGAGKIGLLPPTCAVYANHGRWVSLNGCDEGSRGEEYRKHGISTVSTCSSSSSNDDSSSSSLVWGWDDQPSNTLCRFKHRDSKSLRKHLNDRTIYFVGDSVTRYVYHAFCRQLGITNAGAYDASAGKHHDLSQTIENGNNNNNNIKIQFVWAAYATEVVEAINAFVPTNNNNDNKNENKPDLVVLGGGAWDKLWKYETDEEQKTFESVLGDLKVGIQSLTKGSSGIPVVYLTPTTINTPALSTPEKQERITEDEMKLMRELYQTIGILSSSSFVIDGEAFTSTRVGESYDGVHYPHNVYSAGAQILCNALDWLLPPPLNNNNNNNNKAKAKKLPLPPPPKQPGEMAHPKIGLLILCFAVVGGILFFDGFLGFSYLAALIVPGVAPKRLVYEAFSTLHSTKNLPSLLLELQQQQQQQQHQMQQEIPTISTRRSDNNNNNNNNSSSAVAVVVGSISSMNSSNKNIINEAAEEEVESLIGKER